MSEWISVDERLPTDNDSVLVCIKFVNDDSGESQCEVASVFDHPEAWRGENNSNNKCNWYVTHWMPLPEPPK